MLWSSNTRLWPGLLLLSGVVMTINHSIESGGLWKRTPTIGNPGPSLYKASFSIKSQPQDTFADMTVIHRIGIQQFLHSMLQGWSKGVLFVNGVNVGRYWSVGPQKSLYIPAPLLRKGPNTVCH